MSYNNGPSDRWVLALVEVLYFGPSTLPLVYLLWTHRHSPLAPSWVLLLLFAILQVTGSGMILSAGQNGIPSAVATIIVQVGLSPVMLALSSVVHAYARLAGLVPQRKERMVMVANVVFHLAVVSAIALYAGGASDAFKRPRPENARTLYEAGVLVLLALFVILCAVFAFVAVKTRGAHMAGALFPSILISLLLLAVRMVYSTIAAFCANDPQFNPVTGRIVYEIVLVFLPGALIVAAMIAGGAMTTNVEVPNYDAVPTGRGAVAKKMPASSSV